MLAGHTLHHSHCYAVLHEFVLALCLRNPAVPIVIWGNTRLCVQGGAAMHEDRAAAHGSSTI